ncbi:MAG: hypothetical protein KBT36_09385 [Kurthia sp.]|nr:hypothetical protein [Candidatus Kurthia equi]
MEQQEQRLIKDIEQIISTYASETVKEELVTRSEEIVEAAQAYMTFISPEFTNDDIGKLMFRLTNNCDTYTRKALSGMTLAVIMGMNRFTQDTAGRLTGSFIQMVVGSVDSPARTSIILLMRDIYSAAKQSKK